MSSNLLNWVKTSPTFKVLTVLIITLILLIPAFKIESLIRERQQLQREVVEEISAKWGAEQTLSGPILTLPYTQVQNKDTPNEKVETMYLHVLPEELLIDGKLAPKIKKRSIYKAILYTSEVGISGRFDLKKVEETGLDTSAIQWQKATLSVGITDPRGISDIGKFSLNDKTISMEPGVPQSLGFKDGIHGSVPIRPGDTEMSFSGAVSLKGSSGIHFVPLGKTTKAHILSTWADPKFSGSFLPNSHDISDEGFAADWKILDYNRSFSQIWDNRVPNIYKWKFGVDLIEAVNIYQKTNRAIKYAFMIIALTFTFFFFFEILRKLKIHPIQYTIVGFAVLIFYLLLIALSEQMTFGLAFLISAVATVSIVGYYFYFISKSMRITLFFSLIFGFLYAFIYVILNAQAYSLLIGSIGLFVLIVLVMHFTRNINWYQNTKEELQE